MVYRVSTKTILQSIRLKKAHFLGQFVDIRSKLCVPRTKDQGYFQCLVEPVTAGPLLLLGMPGGGTCPCSLLPVPGTWVLYQLIEYWPGTWVLYQILEDCTRYWRTVPGTRVLYHILEDCTRYWRTVPGTRVLYHILEDCTIYLRTVQEIGRS